MKQRYRFWFVGVVAVVVVAAVALTGGNATGPDRTLALQAPAFVQASSQENSGMPEEVAAMLSDEAGISAYMQTSSAIDLNQVDGEFRTIETQTSDYIIGSVPVPDHPEHFDVHVYVHSDGWILAYYMEDEATSKIVDVKAGTINSTKLETIVSIIAGAAGEAVNDLKYYDFRYPNATNILMVAEDQIEGKDFTITLPTDYGYSERSFAIYNTNAQSDGLDLNIDGARVSRSYDYFEAHYTAMSYGVISASELLPGQSHYVKLGYGDPYGVLVITYRVQ